MGTKKRVGSGLRYANTGEVLTLLDAATATGAGTAVESNGVSQRLYQAYLSTSTTPSGTVTVEGSIDGTHWAVLATIVLSGSNDSGSADITGDWSYVRGNVTAIAGASATLTLLMRA